MDTKKRVSSEDLKSTKMPGTINLTDALTKYCDVHVLNLHVENTNQNISSLKNKLTQSI